MLSPNISQEVININILTIIISIVSIVANICFAHRIALKRGLIILFPSVIIPLLIVVGYCIPLSWASFDAEFEIKLISYSHLEEAALVVFVFTFLIITGLLFGRNQVLFKNRVRPPDRILDVVLNGRLGNEVIFFLIIASIFVFPFAFALRIDLIFNEGIRGLKVDNEILFALIPLARIMLSILTIFSGIIFANTNNKVIFIVPFLDMLQQLMKLSRGFFIPVLLFLFSSSLSGKKYKIWVYLFLPIISIFGGSAAISARQLSTQGFQALSSEVTQTNTDIIDSIRVFFEANSVIGVISTAISFREPSRNVIDGFLAWFQSILPIPTFFKLTGSHLSIAELIGRDNIGIPMPALGEIFFQMGWIGLLVFLLMGFFIGKIEGELMRHTLIYDKPYWSHVLIWMSIMFGFILSLHSPSRSASRLLLYSIVFISVLENTLKIMSNQYRK